MHKIRLNDKMIVKLQNMRKHYILGCCDMPPVNPLLCMGNFLNVLANDLWRDKKYRLSRAFDKVATKWHEQHNGCSMEFPTEIILKRGK